MTRPPDYLRPDVAAAFEEAAVASSYDLRPSYPPAVFPILSHLIVDRPRAALDIGCGTGFLARPLTQMVDRVDAVDASAAMIDEGKRLPGGQQPNLNWMLGRAETVPLFKPYSLITAGDSLHWMEWDAVLPRLAAAISPRGSLALLTVEAEPAGDDAGLRESCTDLIRAYTTCGPWQPGFDLVEELKRRELFREAGRTLAESTARQSVDEFVESFHARASLSWERMRPDDLASFDQAMRQLMTERFGDTVELRVRAEVVWGRPLGGR